MSKHRTRTAAADRAAPFTPVPVRQRHDGWTPGKQLLFIRALGETACVTEACEHVGMSVRSAYALRARPAADSFRQAWDMALDVAVGRLADAMLGRALHGVATPIFYRGEQIGERRRYDERLAMFILRHRDPVRYGAWRDQVAYRRDDPDGAAKLLDEATRRLAQDIADDGAGRARRVRPPLVAAVHNDDPAVVEATERAEHRRQEAARERYLRSLEEATEDLPRPSLEPGT